MARNKYTNYEKKIIIALIFTGLILPLNKQLTAQDFERPTQLNAGLGVWGIPIYAE